MATLTAFPTPPIPPTGLALALWSQALDDAYAKAQTAMPDAGERLTKALALVKSGAVEHAAQWGAYHYTVASASDPTGLRTYDVHAQAPLSCTCEAWLQSPKKGTSASCQHLLAVWLYRRALNQVPVKEAAPATTPHSGPQAVEKAALVPPLPEAAFSLCLKGRLAGHDAQLTIRGGTYAEFAANVAAVRGLLDTAAAPTSAGETRREAERTPADATPTCPTHGPMKASTKAPGTWYCTKKLYDGSYCKSRWPEKGA